MRALPICALAMYCAVLVAAPNDIAMIPGKSYAQGGAKWSDRLSRREAGYPAYCKMNKVRGDCFIDEMMVRNDSDFDLRCKVSVDYPRDMADVQIVTIIDAHSERTVNLVEAVPAKVVPTSFASVCEQVPALPALATPDTCSFKILKARNGDDYYPPRSKRLGEQGTVILEFTLAQEIGTASDVAVARSSEHADLDMAAQKLLATATFKTNCAGQRFRKPIPFILGSH
jgi:TonB family protein